MIARFVGLARAVRSQRTLGTRFIGTFKPVVSGRAYLSRHILAVAILLAIGLVATSRLPRTVYAIVVGCRGDPIVFLSNGQRIQMTAEIATNAADVSDVTYTVHAPVGTSVTRVVYTGGPLASKERLVFYDDLSPGRYSTETLVRVRGADVGVSARTAMRSVIQSVSGLSGQPLIVTIDLDQ